MHNLLSTTQVLSRIVVRVRFFMWHGILLSGVCSVNKLMLILYFLQACNNWLPRRPHSNSRELFSSCWCRPRHRHQEIKPSNFCRHENFFPLLRRELHSGHRPRLSCGQNYCMTQQSQLLTRGHKSCFTFLKVPNYFSTSCGQKPGGLESLGLIPFSNLSELIKD